MARVEDSELFIRAAIEARRASRIYWIEGGPADRKYPVHPDVERNWPLDGSEPVPAAANEAKQRRLRRERR